MPKTLISLGMSCQCAHQLARFADDNPHLAKFQKGPFDWLICPAQSAASWLDENLADFDPSHLEIRQDHVWWPHHNFWFWHGFHTKTETDTHIEIAANSDRETSKLDYQRQFFRSIDPQNACFFVSNTQNNLETEVYSRQERANFHFDTPAITRLQSALTRYFGRAVELRIVTRKDRASPDILSLQNTVILPQETSQWKGSNPDWDNALTTLLA